MSETTTTPETTQTPPSDRGSDGRFLPGNPGGPGNPFTRECARMRKAFVEVFTPETLRQFAEIVKQLALQGDKAMLRLALEYSIGKPTKTPEPDQLDLEEWELLKAESRTFAEMPEVAQLPAADLSLRVTRFLRPEVTARVGKTIVDRVNEPQKREKAALRKGKKNRKKRHGAPIANGAGKVPPKAVERPPFGDDPGSISVLGGS